MFENSIILLDWIGIVVFTITGALVASRNQMDVIGFNHVWMAAKRLSDTPDKGAGGRDCKPGHPFR